ncbi:hypothetical protein HMPREF1590_00607 [Escherichia coli 113302]|nr:hypothetical protein HMPREF1590_00607 [Escherichia coli 113302]
MTNLFVRSGISFVDRSEVLTHIGNEMLAKGVVHDTWPQALIAREAEFPTGIMLERTPLQYRIVRRFMLSRQPFIC